MTITNKYPGKCSVCSTPVAPGKGAAVKSGDGSWQVRCAVHSGGHVAQEPAMPSRSTFGGGSRVWDATKFNGYGARNGGYVRACKTGGNCSSFGSGRSCGGHDCDGH